MADALEISKSGFFAHQRKEECARVQQDKELLGALANLTEYPRTLHKLQELHLKIDNVISGHWSPVHGPELIDQYLRMLKDYSQKAAKD